jgi:hypothetical protein
MAWLMQDEYTRIPATQQEFAKTINRSEETLSRWKNIPGWDDEIKARTWEVVRNEYPQIIHALIRGAKKENPVHIRLILELLGEIGAENQAKHGDINIIIAEAHNYLDPTETAPGTSANGSRIVEVQRG